jgi:hypothetical protein
VWNIRCYSQVGNKLQSVCTTQYLVGHQNRTAKMVSVSPICERQKCYLFPVSLARSLAAPFPCFLSTLWACFSVFSFPDVSSYNSMVSLDALDFAFCFLAFGTAISSISSATSECFLFFCPFLSARFSGLVCAISLTFPFPGVIHSGSSSLPGSTQSSFFCHGYWYSYPSLSSHFSLHPL